MRVHRSQRRSREVTGAPERTYVIAEYLWLIIDSAYVTDLTPMRQFCALTRVNALVF